MCGRHQDKEGVEHGQHKEERGIDHLRNRALSDGDWTPRLREPPMRARQLASELTGTKTQVMTRAKAIPLHKFQKPNHHARPS